MIKVEQFHNKNQFVVFSDNKIFFQSYSSCIALIDENVELSLYQHWYYSKTTLKHLKFFLEEYNWNGKEYINFDKPIKLQLDKLIKKGIIIKCYN